ncbi:MAG: hypothetical protein N2170_06045 [Bacteroidia bacterium]|nr:hypothetical protein [Bacteroidia bacterium]
MRPARIFLIGPPAAGKSTIGQKWARRLGVPFYDTDAEIERRTGIAVPDWLIQRGEGAFREVEKAVLYKLLQESSWGIWAMGGGLPAQEDVLPYLRSEGYLLWIDPPAAWLVARLRDSLQVRPLLSALSAEQQLQLIEARRVFYRWADLHWRPSSVSEEVVYEWVKRCLSTRR